MKSIWDIHSWVSRSQHKRQAESRFSQCGSLSKSDVLANPDPFITGLPLQNLISLLASIETIATFGGPKKGWRDHCHFNGKTTAHWTAAKLKGKDGPNTCSPCTSWCQRSCFTGRHFASLSCKFTWNSGSPKKRFLQKECCWVPCDFTEKSRTTRPPYCCESQRSLHFPREHHSKDTSKLIVTLNTTQRTCQSRGQHRTAIR